MVQHQTVLRFFNGWIVMHSSPTPRQLSEAFPVSTVTWNIFSHSWRPVGGWTDVILRRCCPCPLAALRSPNVVGVAEHGTSPVVLKKRKRYKRKQRQVLLRTMNSDFIRITIWYSSNISTAMPFAGYSQRAGTHKAYFAFFLSSCTRDGLTV